MKKAGYILFLFLCTQLFVVGQVSQVDDLLEQALSIMEEQPKKAIIVTQKAFEVASRNGDSFGLITAKSVMGDISMSMEDYEAAYINFNDALEFLDSSDTTDLYNKTSLLNNLAIIKSYYGDHAGSASLYEAAVETANQYVSEYRDMAEEYGDIRLLVDLPFELSFELRKDGRYLEAGEILVDLWEESEFKQDTVLLAKVVNLLGLIKQENGEYNQAQEFYAIAAFGEGVDSELKAKALHNLAATYLEQSDLVKAEKYFNAALEIKKSNGDEYAQFITLLDLGELAYVQNNVEAAISKWESALQVYDKIESYPDLFIVYDWLQKAYRTTDLNKSVEYSDLYAANFKSWMTIQSNQKDTSPTLQAFNTRIDTILADRALKAERLALLRQYWPLGVVALLLIMLFVYMVQMSFNKRRARAFEASLKADRASVADEILNRIRRD